MLGCWYRSMGKNSQSQEVNKKVYLLTKQGKGSNVKSNAGPEG